MSDFGPSGKLRSPSQFSFSRSPEAIIPRSSFNRSFGLKTTFDAGYLVPIYWDEALPGDSFNLRATLFGRLSTPIYPLMDNLTLSTYFFAVPNRLIWSNWEKFNGEQVNPGDSTSFLVPTSTAPGGGYAELSLHDYFGIPTKVTGVVHDNLHLRAYNLIYNEWFRDQNLTNSVTVDLGDGPDTYSNYVLLRASKKHDYFTSCLPFAQKGTAVAIPLTGTAPVTGIALSNAISFGSTGTNVWETNAAASTNYTASYPSSAAVFFKGVSVGAIGSSNTPQIFANLAAASATTINALRQSFQIQKMYERDARGGTRYTEVIRSHFGVISPDMRQQRPEYLGGGMSPVVIQPVAQTAATSGSNALGDLAGFGTVHANNHGFTKSFTEHCVLIGLVLVRSDLTYQQGLERFWSRQTRFDFYWPALSHLGEQNVLNKEIYYQNTAADANTFGYQERWAEYRYKPSVITGRFRSNATTPLDAWHLAQNFGALPVLNNAFIQETPPMSRIKAVTTEPDFLLDAYFTLHSARPMPVYSVPGLIDHF